MKSTYSPPTRIIVGLLLIAIVLLLSLPAFSAPKTTSPSAQMPDVLIWIDARNPTANWIAIIYPKLVSKSAAQASVATLLKETGWTTDDVKITNDSIVKSGANPMTAVEFMTRPTVKLDSGYLPIEPIIKAFRQAKLMEIQYMLPQTFQFRGIGDFSNQYVQIKLISGNNAYRYSVHINNPNFTTLNLPKPQSPVIPVAKQARHSGWIVTALIATLALMAAIIAFMLSVRFTNSRLRTGR